MATGVRNITNRGIHRVTGKFASAKMKDVVHWESQIERDFIYYIEFDTDIIRYASQPVVMNYPFEGKIREHTPDFEVWRKSSERRKFIENKPFEETLKTEFIEKTRAISAYLRTLDIDYQVVTEKDIRIPPRLENLKILQRYSHVEVTPDEATLIESVLSQMEKPTLGMLHKEINKYNLSLHHCYAMMAFGFIHFDLMIPISLSLPVRLPSHKE